MNLWGRIAALCILVFVFLVSCKDELNTIGFKSSIQKIKVSYAEIDLPSSVMITDSLATYNQPTFTATQRWLLGHYHDDKFGDISSSVIFQLRPTQPGFVMPDDATLNSVSLVLTADYYFYGPTTPGKVSFAVHELTDSLTSYTTEGDPTKQYYFNTEVPYNPTPIGTGEFSVDPEIFKTSLQEDSVFTTTKDSSYLHIDTVEVILSNTYANSLFDLVKKGGDNYTAFTKFRRIFKGFTLIPDPSSDFIIGLNPDHEKGKLTVSRVKMTYTTSSSGASQTKVLEFDLYKFTDLLLGTSYNIGFSKISADRSGTDLSQLSVPYQTVAFSSGQRYIQAGNPVATKLDFSKFFEFSDTIPNFSINSAELAIVGVSKDSFDPPTTLTLRILRPNNHYDNSNYVTQNYIGRLGKDKEGRLVFSGDDGNQFKLKRSENGGEYAYSGFLTSYLQAAHAESDTTRYVSYAIIPYAPEFQKSVNRLQFSSDNVKLRLYYTTPVGEK